MNYSKPIINIKNDYQYLTTNMMDYNGADKKYILLNLPALLTGRVRD